VPAVPDRQLGEVAAIADPETGRPAIAPDLEGDVLVVLDGNIEALDVDVQDAFVADLQGVVGSPVGRTFAAEPADLPPADGVLLPHLARVGRVPAEDRQELLYPGARGGLGLLGRQGFLVQLAELRNQRRQGPLRPLPGVRHSRRA